MIVFGEFEIHYGQFHKTLNLEGGELEIAITKNVQSRMALEKDLKS